MKLFILGATLFHSVMIAGVPRIHDGEKLAIIKGYPFLDVSINRRGPFRMMIDTGSSSCSLTLEAARTAGLVFDHRVLLASMVTERPVPATSSATIRVGPVEARGVEVLAMPLDGVRAVSAQVDGILGQSFLNRFAYLIDYRRKRFWLGDEATRHAPWTGEIPVDRAFERLVVPVVLQRGRPWRMILDSGASDVVVQCGGHCSSLVEVWSSGKILTNAGQRSTRSGMLESIGVGALTVFHVQAALVEAPHEFSQWDGVLPTRYFSVIYVDNARNTVRLAR